MNIRHNFFKIITTIGFLFTAGSTVKLYPAERPIHWTQLIEIYSNEMPKNTTMRTMEDEMHYREWKS